MVLPRPSNIVFKAPFKQTRMTPDTHAMHLSAAQLPGKMPYTGDRLLPLLLPLPSPLLLLLWA